MMDAERRAELRKVLSAGGWTPHDTTDHVCECSCCLEIRRTRNLVRELVADIDAAKMTDVQRHEVARELLMIGLVAASAKDKGKAREALEQLNGVASRLGVKAELDFQTDHYYGHAQAIIKKRRETDRN